MEYLLVVDGVQEDMVASGTSSGNWSCTPVTDYFSYANRLWTVGSGDVTGIVYGTCDSCLTSPPSPPTAGASAYCGCSDISFPESAELPSSIALRLQITALIQYMLRLNLLIQILLIFQLLIVLLRAMLLEQ